MKRVKINFVSIAGKMGETVFIWIFTGTNIKDYYLSFWVENHILIYFRRALSNIRIFSSLNVYIGVETSKLHIRKYLTLRPEIQDTVQCIQEWLLQMVQYAYFSSKKGGGIPVKYRFLAPYTRVKSVGPCHLIW